MNGIIRHGVRTSPFCRFPISVRGAEPARDPGTGELPGIVKIRNERRNF